MRQCSRSWQSTAISPLEDFPLPLRRSFTIPRLRDGQTSGARLRIVHDAFAPSSGLHPTQSARTICRVGDEKGGLSRSSRDRPGHIWPFEAIAMQARQSKVFKLGFALMLSRNDVIYREWCWMKCRGQLTSQQFPARSQTFRMR